MAENNCHKCSEVDTEDMVQCDTCDHWYHFECAGVDQNVANVSWSCEYCRGAVPTATTSFVTNASTPTTGNAQDGNYQRPPLHIPEINRKVDLSLPTTGLADPAHTFVNNERIIKAVATTTSFSPFQTLAPLPSLYTAPIMSFQPLVSRPNNHHQFIPAFTQPNFSVNCSHSSTFYPQVQSRTTRSTVDSNLDNVKRQRNLELKRLEEEMQYRQQYLEAKYKILSESNESSTPNIQNLTSNVGQTLPTMASVGPTPAQLAARQSFPKQLPNFNGDPDEWPLFISSFENSTKLAGYTDAENLIRLQSALKGKAREMVKNKLLLPHMVPEILRTLRMCFGRPEHILERAINRAKGFPPIKDKLEMLIEFAVCVQNICSTMEGCQMYSHLNNPLLVKELVDKLPNNHKLSWAMCHKDDRVPVVKSFSDWLYSLAEAASSVTQLHSKSTVSINTHTREEDKSEPKVNKHAVSTTCIVCNKGSHKVAQCNIFKNMSLNNKWEFVKANHLCRQCLSRHRRKCIYNKECGIDECKFKHHSLLHKMSGTASNSAEIKPNSNVNAHSKQFSELQPWFRIIPVNIHSSNKTKKVFAFLDEGSAVSLIEESVFDELGFTGESDPICLKWTGDTTRMESESKKGDIIISNVANNKKFKLSSVHTVTNLGLSAQTIDAEEISKRYPYLAKLPIESYRNATPSILIGADNWNLAVPLKIREGSWQQPIASKTRLGWTLQGRSNNGTMEYPINIHVCDCQPKYNELHEMVKDYFNMESSRPMQLFSSEDSKALTILKDTCKKVKGRYEVGLLWRNQSVCLPDSYNLALSRLNCLENKFSKDPSLRTIIQSQIDNLLQKGYAIKLKPEEIKMHHQKTWYLPIFTVLNPNKPEKIRLVWDAAAKSNGVSLNDFLVVGPDLLRPLVEILLKFRIGKIAICADISEMFHRINVREGDMHAQRFLWRETGDKHSPPSIFVMRALTFGINCAPCIAHYIRDKNAEFFKNKYPRAVQAIQENHYVDDFIDSAPNEQQAIELATNVQKIHEAGGFKMHNWASNSKTVLEQLHANISSEQTMKNWCSTTKILGLYWDANNDEFRYICRFSRLRRNVLGDSLTPTKRETLQILMSLYDPLGFASCYTIGLKILLQEIWRSGITWDKKLTGTLEKEWYKWKLTIEKITLIRIPRCYSPLMPTADEIQLHTFVDASESAYAAVCYLRIKKNNVINVSLVAAKNKVAPLKPLSVPRLELQAAVLGTRLAKSILQVREIKTDSQFWWSDSKTVLRWLKIDPKRFHQFVMHRVGEIHENTNINQWKWVPSKQNPADLATKVASQSSTEIWFNGPQFLNADASEWPNCSDLGPQDNIEIKHCTLVIKNVFHLQINVEYFSDWRRLCRAMAIIMLYCFRLMELVRHKFIKKYVEIDCHMIKKAQMFLIKYAQYSEYSVEINNLTLNKPVQKNSKLISLSVYLDQHGVIRARGRAEYLNNHEDVVVLPTNHHITFLLVKQFHEKFYHQNHETALNEIKGQYHIPKLRTLFRKIRRTCQWCKINYATPQTPQMAALPSARLAAFERPFTYVGLDYFGPISVTVGRRYEKRWGVIFTCLSIRAIHIEVAHSLDTSSCIMSIRNFISRRGTPREIYSDNGTNFKAAEKILCSQLKNIDLSEIKTAFEQIKWKFNPPCAPHMGGAWERLVRSVKTVLYSICASTKFSDESLKNALCETEFTINSRPLTFVSIECGDDQAITPNHLLIGSSDGYKPVANNDIDLRHRWYKTQEFADQFWRRWLKDYIPVISRRSKWFNKQPPIKIGDVVVIVDPDLPRNCWPKGRVIDVILAKDGQVRRATVKTINGIYQRPAAKLAVLDVSGTVESKLDPSISFTEEGIVAAKSK